MHTRTLALTAMLAATAAAAEPANLWATPGGVSYHLTHRERNHNEVNGGFGIEYQHSDARATMLGVYRNSQDRWSRYALYQWTPVAMGKYVRVGAQGGLVDGYRKLGVTPVIVPTASIETRRYGLNVSFLPEVKSANNAAAITLQFKARF